MFSAGNTIMLFTFKGLRPGLIQMIHYVGQGIYYNTETDPSLSQFMAILEWETPTGNLIDFCL